MDELVMQEIIRTNYSGSVSQMSAYTGIAAQVLGVIIGGIILWRASAVYHKKKKKERSRNAFFETPYSRGWKRK